MLVKVLQRSRLVGVDIYVNKVGIGSHNYGSGEICYLQAGEAGTCNLLSKSEGLRTRGAIGTKPRFKSKGLENVRVAGRADGIGFNLRPQHPCPRTGEDDVPSRAKRTDLAFLHLSVLLRSLTDGMMPTCSCEGSLYSVS